MRNILTRAALAAAILLSVGAALAQGPRYGPGPGGGPGYGRGGMGPRVGSDYTPGWSMMTPGERDAHRKLMEQRARERGVAAMPGPRHDACPAAGG